MGQNGRIGGRAVLALLAIFGAGAVAAPALVRWWGLRAFYALAAIPGAALGWTATRTGIIAAGGDTRERYGWVGTLGLDITLRMNALSWLMVVLVTGIGALVLIYCGRYFAANEPGLGRFAGYFVGFAGSMYGLVVSDNLLLLYVFWELTTVFSYLLIGHRPSFGATRRAAAQALMVTSLGGLAMLAGLVMLGERAGTFELSGVAARPPPSSAFLSVSLLLILVGALSKSAIWPFSFWLPAAMAAPTPVSAYLHAAAMVKAGVYLMAAFAPFSADVAGWRPVVGVLGLATMVMGGWTALRRTDLKLLLASGTVSQLGLITVVIGWGTYDTALAGLALLAAHALFKATLFLVVGIIEHETGTRDLRRLSGLWRRTPVMFVVACLGALSMAGVPPLFGFVAKESALEAEIHRWPVLAGVVAGSALTVAYAARFLWGAFATKPGTPTTETHTPHPTFLAPPAVLGAAGVVLVGWLGPVNAVLSQYAHEAGAGTDHLALWHGLTPALGLSALAVIAGLVLFGFRGWVGRAVAAVRSRHDGAWTFGRITHALDRAAVEVTSTTQRGSMPFYLGTILSTLVLVVGVALIVGRPRVNVDRLVAWSNTVEPVVAALTAIAALYAVRSRRRFTAMLLVALTGYGTAALFVLHGAPDLGLTQFLVETVSTVVFVLVLRRLPTHFSVRLLRGSRWLRRGIGAVVGVVIAVLGMLAIGSRQAPTIANGFPAAAVDIGGGRNVVNVTLVDIRAWDTLGEISVLVVAATGVASLIFVRPRIGPRPRRGAPAKAGENHLRGSWLAGARGLPAEHRYIMLEVVTRVLFPPMVLYSVYLLFSGHNAPGGGFTGGLVAGMALAIRYLAGGRHELDEAAPVDAGRLLALGLFFAVGTALVPLLSGRTVLESAKIDFHVPVIGDAHLVTSLFFDMGVYLVVIGLVLDILRSLGSGIDMQAEESQEVHA